MSAFGVQGMSVDAPNVTTYKGKPQLELLKGVSGAFRPGVLTCLMGVSGAGKTTLMDVLAGRKTSENALPSPRIYVYIYAVHVADLHSLSDDAMLPMVQYIKSRR